MDDEVAVTIVGSQPEADPACQLLRNEGIACYDRPTSFAAGAGDGLVSLGSPREIVVRAKDAARARELLLDASACSTQTKRRSPLVRKATLPSRIAKIVSSLPIPAPDPGRKRVPRWRTRIIPAVTSWPAKSFTPSIFGFEAPPFRR